MPKPSALLSTISLSLAPHLEEARAKGLCCALSGGADSVALLLALQDLNIPTKALHCNFHLRGEESQRDEDFVRQLCSHLDIPLEVRHFDTHGEARHSGESIEMVARRQRYTWFAQQARPVAVAHHADDNVETLLLNLLRGTGLRGLTGMDSDNKRGILRPLLAVTRQELLDYLQAKGQSHCVDSSNADTHYRRNALRHELLPLLRKLNPSIDLTLARTIERLQSQWAVYQIGLATLHKMLAPLVLGRKLTYPRDAITAQGEAGQAYLFEQLSPLGFDATQVQGMLAARTGALFHSPSHTACVAVQGLEVQPKKDDTHYALHCEEHERTATFQPARCSNCATIDSQSFSGLLHLRHPREGERFQPYGMLQGSRLVNDYLADRHISRLERQLSLAVCDEEGIVWLVGHTIAHRCAVTPTTTHITTLRLVEQEEASPTPSPPR